MRNLAISAFRRASSSSLRRAASSSSGLAGEAEGGGGRFFFALAGDFGCVGVASSARRAEEILGATACAHKRHAHRSKNGVKVHCRERSTARVQRCAAGRLDRRWVMATHGGGNYRGIG